MSPLSSNTLFHFTNSRENLLNILENEFRPHYSLETLGVFFQEILPPEFEKIAFPLVSFCDIPLSQTRVHMDTYGKYALGLTKDWAMASGVTPVLYFHKGSIIANGISNLIRTIFGNHPAPEVVPFVPPLDQIIHFTKLYEGAIARGNAPPKTVRFYDEREWRFVPENPPGLSETDWANNEKREDAQTRAMELGPLSFQPKDIRFIIVEREDEILPTIRQVEMIKSKFSADDVKLLSSRFLSAERIQEDF